MSIIGTKTSNSSNSNNSRVLTGQLTQKIWRVGAYLRLSSEDELVREKVRAESNSINTQRDIIDRYINQSPLEFELVEYYQDDGITGTSVARRAGFLQMVKDIEDGVIDCVIVKDPSRLFRSTVDTHKYLVDMFKKHKVRFISLSSPSLDTLDDPEAIEDIPFQIITMFNEYHSKSTSKKVRGGLNNKFQKGEIIARYAIYGYKKDPGNKYKWLVDEEAAEVIRKIYNLYIQESYSIAGIALELTRLGILTPAEHKAKNGITNSLLDKKKRQSSWHHSHLRQILSDERYLGHAVQGRIERESYKSTQRIFKSKDEWFIVKNTHEAIAL